jgi:urease accessory protein
MPMHRMTEVLAAGHWPRDRRRAAVALDFDGRFVRRRRLMADDGTELLLDLPAARRLVAGDGLMLPDGGIVEVVALPEALVEVRAESAARLARLAWHLGNRHLPVEIADDVILIRDDHVIVDMVERLGATVRRVQRPFNPEGGAYGQHNHDPAQPHRHAEHHDADHG